MDMQDTSKQPLPQWYDRMLDSIPLMLAFVMLSLLLSPVLFIYGALYPLFRR